MKKKMLPIPGLKKVLSESQNHWLSKTNLDRPLLCPFTVISVSGSMFLNISQLTALKITQIPVKHFKASFKDSAAFFIPHTPTPFFPQENCSLVNETNVFI
jgi:hypothetical protein